MRLQALKDSVVNGKAIKAGAIIVVSKRYGEKLIREGQARALDDKTERLETK